MRCSIVFGVTLRLLVINISSSSPAVAAYYQGCVTTCGRWPWSTGDCVDDTRLLQRQQQSDTGLESRFLSTSPVFDAPARGVSVGVLLCRLARKTRMMWLLEGEKNLICLLALTEFTKVTDTHTDRHTLRQTDTQTPHDDIGRACIASRDHNGNV